MYVFGGKTMQYETTISREEQWRQIARFVTYQVRKMQNMELSKMTTWRDKLD